MLILKIVLLIKLVAVAFTTGFKAHQHMPMDDLTSDELRQTFGVLRSEHVPKHEQLLPQASFHPDGRLERLVIDLERQLHELDFYSVTDDLISREMITVYRHGDDDRGDLRVDEKPTDCHFHHKSNQTYAAVSTCDGNLKGVIVKPWGAYVLHPMPERHQQRFKRSGDSVGLHVLYKREVADAPEQEFCGIKSTITSQELEEDESAIHEDVFVVGERLTQESELVVELAIFIDSILWAQFQSKHAGAAEQKLQDYALTMLNNIQIMYHQPSMTRSNHHVPPRPRGNFLRRKQVV
uniref:Peptidase M12B propeptide domain-containing protein n=1 Tax=Plectus sambesii TaxID=2011161 RepID=A0A914VWV6_9BILA